MKIFRYLVFVIFFPATVAVWIPLIITSLYNNSFDIGYWKWLAIIPWLAGGVMFVSAVLMFYYHSGGTPTVRFLHPLSHLIGKESNRLVASGIYRFSRNPMYTGVLLLLAGNVLFSGNIGLVCYWLLVFAGFNVFIIFYEEPSLRIKHGDVYDEFCKRVPRWL